MNKKVVRLLADCVRTLLPAILSSALLIPVFAQQSVSSPDESVRPKFLYDVVSVRECKAGGFFQDRSSANGCIFRCAPLWTLLYRAYYPALLTSDQLIGMPSWATSTQFDVEARMDDDTAAALQKFPDKEQAEQRKLMLQAILADRFQLKIHREARERQAYDLIIAKGGPKLTELKPGESPGGSAMRSGRIDVHGFPMGALAEVLTHVVGRRVVDKTGLTGKYVMTVVYAPDEPNGMESDAPSIFTALEEQLGMKLIPSKASVDVIVIDHVERPSEN